MNGVAGKIALVCLLISTLGCLLAGIFTTDPINTEINSISGSLHNLGGTLAIAIPLSVLFVYISIHKSAIIGYDTRQMLFITILALLGFSISAGSLGYLFSQPGAKPGPDLWVGIPTRFEVLTYCIWLLVVSKSISRFNQIKTYIPPDVS